MGYAEQSDLSVDADFRVRIAACVSTEGFAAPGEHPTVWADHNQWAVASKPGLADAYAYALATGVERPGRDPAVISDGQILAAVTAVQSEISGPPGAVAP